MHRIRLTILFMFFCVLSFAQTIDIVNFNSSTDYCAGSGVSVHINPTGVFTLENAGNLQDSANNSFILEISGAGGDWSNPTTLNTVYDFYTPLINGTLPTNLEVGDYQLRVRSTQPAVTSASTSTISVGECTSSISDVPSVTTNMDSNSNFTQCLNEDANIINPYIGSMNQNYNSLSGSMPSSYQFFTVNPTDSNNTIAVRLIDIENGTSTAVPAISGNIYQIPADLTVGTYNFEITETDLSGNVSVFAYTFLFHTSATIFGNASSETVCVGEEVTFSVDTSNLGIGSNYMGSYYIVNFGDGSSPEIYTQAELLELYSNPIDPITHVFDQPSCSANGNNSFIVSKKLFNKGLVNSSNEPQCDSYVQNGLGASKEIATAESPEAEFNLNPEQCVNEDIEAINTTTPGSYPTTSGECAGEVNFDWQVKKPSFSDFLPVSLLNSSWVVGDDLLIPASDVDEVGCWEIKLIAVNPAACLAESVYTDTVNIEDIPDADFNDIGDICQNQQITLTDASNIIEAVCDPTLPNETPTYVWSVSPNSGYTLGNDNDGNPTTLNSQNPVITFTEVGTYTVDLTVTTECGSDTHSETFDVLGNPTVSFPIASQTYCSTNTLLVDFQNQITPTYSTAFSAPTDYTWTVSGSGITNSDYAFVNGTTNSDEFPTIQLNSFGTYNITVTVGSNCDTPASDTVVITLSQTPTITNTVTSQDVCSADDSLQFDFTSDVAGTTYSWVATENTNLTGYDESGTTAFIPSQTITNTTNTDQDLVYTITPIADGCAGTPFEYTLTVQPVPLIADKDETICDGETFNIQPTDDSPTEIVPVGTTYSWSVPVSNPVGAITGGSDGASQTSISQALTNITDSLATLTYTVQSEFNGCKGDPFEVVITVNPTVGVDVIADQVLCNGDDTLAVEFSTTIEESTNDEVQESGEISYTWTNDNTDIGLAASGTGNIPSFTATNSTTGPITANITVTSVYTYNDVSCEGESETFSITVNPSPQVEFSEDDQFITSGDTTVPVTLSSPTDGVTFTWTATTENGITGLTTTSGTDTIPAETLFNTTTEPLTVTYTAIATGDVGFDCEGLPTDYVVTVNPLAQVNPVEDQVVCNEENLLIEFTTNITGGTMTYTWTNDNSEIGLSNAGTGNIDITATNTTDAPISGTIVVTPSFENGGDTNVGDPITFEITVNPTGQVNSVGNQIVSNGFDTALVEFSTTNVNGTTTFSWTNDLTSIGLSASGTGDIPAFTAINTGTSPVIATITVTPTFENGGVSCTGPATPFEITVNPTAQVNPTVDLVVTDGDDVDIPFSTINSGGTSTYTWTNTDPTTGLTNTGLSDIGFTAVNTGTSPITTTVVVTPTFENGGNSNSGPTDTFIITVNPTAQINPIENIVVCDEDIINPIVFTTENTGGVTTYSWTNDNTSISLASSGNGTIQGFTAINSSNTTQIATITVIPTFESGGVSNTGPSETFSITVNPTAQVSSISSQILCEGESTDAIEFITTNTDGTTIFNWTNDNTTTGLSSSGTGNIPSFTATNSFNNELISTIVVTPIYTNNGISCDGPSETFTITVNPNAQVDAVVDQVLCNGESTDAIEFTTTNTDGTTVFNWTNDNTTIGLPIAGGSGDIGSFVVLNNTSESQTATFVVTPTYTNNGVSCDGPAETFTISVNPTAQVNAINDQDLCEGEVTAPIEFTTTNIDGITTYEWTNTNPLIGLADSGVGNIPSFEVLNDAANSQNAIITVTPTYTNNGVECTGPSELFILTVNPGAQVNPVDNQILCNDELTDPIQFTTLNTDGVTEYNWTNTNTSIGLPSAGTGDIGSFSVVNTSTSMQSATITVTPTYTNNGVICSGNPEQFTIIVNPSAQINGLADYNTILCDGEFTPVYSFSTANTDGLTTFNWTNNNVAIGLADSGEGGIPSFQLTNSTQSTINATITVTPSYENNGTTCDGNAETFTIIVNPSPEMGNIDDIVLCNNEISSIIEFTTPNTDGNTTYTWINDNTSIGLSSSGNGDIPSFTAINLNPITEVATITVTPTYENNGVVCIGDPQTFSISVLSEIEISGSTVDALDCNDPNSGNINITVTGGSGVYDFLWSNGAITEDLNNIGTGDYSVTVTDSEGCISISETFNIFRQEDLTVQLDTEIVPFCENNLVTQENRITISGGLGPYTVNWSGGSVSINDNTFMTAYQNGLYNVLVTDQYGCQVSTDILIDIDDVFGEASFDYDSNGNIDCGVSIYNELSFFNTSSGDYINVTWDFGDGSALVAGDVVTHQYLNSGAYSVTQTVEYNYGCLEVNTVEIEVTDGYDIVLPNAFSPNGDGMNDTIRPVYTCVNNIEMSIYDTLGSLIYYENNLELNGWDGTLNGKLAENGNYLIVVNGTTIYNEEINLRGVFVLLR